MLIITGHGEKSTTVGSSTVNTDGFPEDCNPVVVNELQEDCSYLPE